MTTDIERVRPARQWSVLGARTGEEVRLESKRLVDAGLHGALVTQTFAPPWANVAPGRRLRRQRAAHLGKAVARRPFEVPRGAAVAAPAVQRCRGPADAG